MRVPKSLGSANMSLVVKAVFGIDRLGANPVRATDLIYGSNLAGRGIPQGVRAGMKGSPSMTFSGDLGALQSFGAVGSARNGVRAGMAQALPGTKGPSASPTVIQNLLGPSPI